MKVKLNKKDAIKSLNLINNLNNLPNDIYSDIEYLKFEVYDENNNLLQKMNYKNNKMTIEQEVEGDQVKMIYLFDNSNSISGKLETYMNEKLFSTMQIKNALPEGEAKIFYPNGKIMTTINFKNGVQDGEAIAYDENGNVVEKVLYKNGNIVK